jgi:hypothetical protein
MIWVGRDTPIQILNVNYGLLIVHSLLFVKWTFGTPLLLKRINKKKRMPSQALPLYSGRATSGKVFNLIEGCHRRVAWESGDQCPMRPPKVDGILFRFT